MKLDPLFGVISFDPIQIFQEIEMPPRSPEFPVRDRFEPNGLLLPNNSANLFIFNGAERIGRQLTPLPLFPGFFNPGRPQKTADLIRPKRSPFCVFTCHALASFRCSTRRR